MKREETIDYHIKATWHAIARMYNAEATKYNLTLSVGYVLLNIDLTHGTPATKIAPLMGLEARSITRVLKSMEREGYIYKVQDEKDRRFFRIFLTEKGKQKRNYASQTVKRFNKMMKEMIEPEKMRIFFEVIQQINQLVEEYQQRIVTAQPS
ncbi:MAG: MarR family transcriptional regulator [Microscillaceae bacterium]|nr:MarR family transcriptional regulator [Microscillaceae bacterium]MDW8460515.1 MarR family transcriptional regulator [Cytophagales bacterium]